MGKKSFQKQLEEAQQTIHALQAELLASQATIDALKQETEQRLTKHTVTLTRANKLLIALGYIASQIEETFDLDQIMKKLGAELKKLDMNYIIALLEQKDKALVLQYHSFESGLLSKIEKMIGQTVKGIRMPPAHFPYYEEVVEKKSPVFVADQILVIKSVLPALPVSIIQRVVKLIGMSPDAPGIYLPLITQEGMFGVLNIWGSELQKEDMQTLLLFARQVAAAFEVARLHKQLQVRHTQEQETLLRFYKILIDLTDRQTVLDATSQIAQEMYQMLVVSLMFPDERGEYLILEGGKGWDKAYYGRYRSEITNMTREGHVFLTGEPLQLVDVQNHPTYPASDALKEMGIVSSLTVPLLGKEKILGTFCVHSRQRREFNPNQVHLLSLIASQSAHALERIRWFEAEQHRAHEAETLRQAGAIVTSTLSKQDAIERILEQLEYVIPYDSASVLMLREDGYLEIVGGRGWNDPAAVMGLRFPIPGDNPNTTVIQEGRPYFLDDVTVSYPTFLESPHGHVQSWLGVPLLVRNHVIGMLAIDSTQPHYFSSKQARLAMAFADQVAIAIYNARLYEAAQRQLDELTVLHAIARAGAKATDEDVLLAEATAVLDDSFDFGKLGIWFLDESGTVLHLHPLYRPRPNMVNIPMPIDQGIIGLVARSGQSYRVPDVTDDPYYLEADSQIRSELCVPLKVGEKTIGVINVASSQLNFFSQDDERFLMTIAGQLATTIARVRSQKARFDSDRRLINLVGMAVDAVIGLDNKQQIIQFNKGAEEIFGYSAAEMLGQSLDILLPEQFRDEHCQHIQNFAAAPEMARRMDDRKAVYGRRRDGSTFPAEASISKLVQEGEITFTVILRDITRRAQHEREREALLTVASTLRLARTRTEMLPIILDQLIALLKVDGTSFTVPDPETDEAVVELGRGIWIQATGTRFSLNLGVGGNVSELGQPVMINDLQTYPNYSQIQLLHGLEAVAGAPLVAQGQLIGSLWIGQKSVITEADLHLLTAVADMAANAIHRATLFEQTQRHAAELERRVDERTQELAEANERLKELDKLKSRFVADVSHELRTPVTVFKLHIGLLNMKIEQSKDVRKHIAILKEQTNRLHQLIEDILDLSRLEIGKHRIQFKPISLNDLVAQVITVHHASAEDKGVALIFTPDAHLPTVVAEKNQLAQVITNLVANAINYTPSGHIEVSTYLAEDGKQVCLQVQDTGRGIAAEDLPHLFERFYRGMDVGQSNIPGSGLGLAIVKEIVDIHGGKIDVESKEEIGTTFRIWLPLQ